MQIFTKSMENTISEDASAIVEINKNCFGKEKCLETLSALNAELFSNILTVSIA